MVGQLLEHPPARSIDARNVISSLPMVLLTKMTPPYKIEFYDANGCAHILNVAWSFEAAEQVVREHVAELRLNEVIRVRDASGTLVLSSDPTE
jgi:hypothetical protein